MSGLARPPLGRLRAYLLQSLIGSMAVVAQHLGIGRDGGTLLPESIADARESELDWEPIIGTLEQHRDGILVRVRIGP